MKNAWEMTQQEFVRFFPSNRKQSQHRSEREKAVFQVAVKIGDQIYVGHPGEMHVQVILRESLPAEKAITGFVDNQRQFFYQYPEEAHRLEVEHALAQGWRVPFEVLSVYPDLFFQAAGYPVYPAVNTVSGNSSI